MVFLVDISSTLSANEQLIDHLRDGKASEEARRTQSSSIPHAIPGTSRGRTRRRQMAEPWHPDPEVVADISNAVQEKVASWMRGAPVLELAITDEDSRSEEGANPATKMRALKTGKLQTADTTILHKITWTHKVIYTCTGQPAEYDQLSITIFVSGFLMVMILEKQSVRPYMLQHLQDLMADADLYGWEPIRAFHAIWFQQLEQSHVTWDNEEVKLKYQRATGNSPLQESSAS